MKYMGTLIRPIVEKPPDGGLLAGNAEFAKEAARIKVAQLEKLPALFEAHGVAFGDYQGLVLALAEMHVAGFKVVAPSGAKVKWQPYDSALFRIAVDDMLSAGEAKSLGHAMQKVSRRPEWQSIIKSKVTESALRKQYDKADQRVIEAVRAAHHFREMTDAQKSRN
jgi:hypothetical protein